MWTERGGAMGIGYEGRTIAELVGELRGLRVTTLVDVRLNAISRKRGFSKRALAEALRAAGIEYVHRPDLGNPQDNRAGYAESWQSETGREARLRYTDYAIATEAGHAAIAQLVDLAIQQRIALLCFEASELHCHRREVLAALHERLEQLVHA
ncbi:DUF488 family protein [Microbacterium sp. B2969]|uniref:DUF488 family protein n=1 Tax=Microbacterium alkaliflavum TaxID=3248839 RepID=A0ABW7Q9D7_9MICO